HQIDSEIVSLQPTPLARSFFRELAKMARTRTKKRNERLGGYVTVLEIAFRVIAPFAEQLNEMPRLREQAVGFNDLVAALNALPLGHSSESASPTSGHRLPAYAKAT